MVHKFISATIHMFHKSFFFIRMCLLLISPDAYGSHGNKSSGGGCNQKTNSNNGIV